MVMGKRYERPNVFVFSNDAISILSQVIQNLEKVLDGSCFYT